jgi:hypothetical protein
MNREEALSLILRAEAAVIRGVGRAYGRTVLKYGDKRYDARQVSEALGNTGEPFIILGGKAGIEPEAQETKIPRTVLEQLGLGALGCFIDGAPILPVPMKAADLLHRGIPGGFRTAFEFGACSWAEDRNLGTEFPRTEFPRTEFPETASRSIPFRETFFRHLDFLRTYGVPGGAVLESPEEAAALLGPYLSGMGNENCRVLVFLRRNFFRLLSGIPPEDGAELPDTLSPRPGAAFRLYETLLKDTVISKDRWDILILTDPGEFLADAGEGRFNLLGNVNTRLRLGIFTDSIKPRGINTLLDPGNNALKRFFGIQGEARDLVRYLFRDPHIPCPLPLPVDLFRGRVRRPPEPFTNEDQTAEYPFPQQNFWNAAVTHGGCFRILGKFQGLNIPLYKDELALFSFIPSRPRDPPEAVIFADPEEGRLPVFGKLNREQRNYFLYWREEFRKERYPAASLPCIYLYARELILTMGGGNPGEYFRELLNLWRIFRNSIPTLDRVFPGWLVDFAVLYGIAGTALDELLPFAEDAGNGILKDLFLHKEYIEQKHPIVLKNLITLFPDKTRMMLLSETETPFLAGEAEAALNKIDRYLQERCQKNFFEFFYPSQAVPLQITAFAPFDDLGHSSYSSEWMCFCEHEPLKQFLDTLVLYLYTRLKGRNGRPVKNGVFPQDPGHPWRRIIDEALEFPIEPEAPPSGISPEEKAAVPAKLRLETEKLPRLREESDMVRELLRIEADEARMKRPMEKAEFSAGSALSVIPAEKRMHITPEAAGKTCPAQSGETGNAGAPSGNAANFLAALDTTERAALKLIARQETREKLEELAKTAGTMPELLIDGINEKFQNYFQDLLIVTEKDSPVIQNEYAEKINNP